MAYFPPRFNVWTQVYRFNGATSRYVLYGYTKCQLRGIASQFQPAFGFNDLLFFEVLFPIGSDIETAEINVNGKRDVLVVAGMGRRYLFVYSFCPKGAGFTNEYLITICQQLNPSEDPGSGFLNSVFHPWRVNSVLEPPEGYTPLPTITPAATWATVLE